MKHLLSNQTSIFIAIVEAGSVTGAAEMLGMGKSGVSDALKQLETSLGVRLLSRTTRRQSLTAMGEMFYRRCKELSNLSTIALEEVSEHLAEPMGPIRITAPHATIQYSIAPAIASLNKRYPRIQPELIVDDKRLDLIKNQIDLALTVGELPDSEFKVQRIGVLQDVLCASPALCERLGLGTPADLAPEVMQDLPYVAHHWEGTEISHNLKAKDASGCVTFRFRRVATATSVHAVFALIQQGVGLGVLPHFFLRERLQRGELVEILPGYEPRANGIYTVHPYGNIPPLSVRVMIDTMKQVLSENTIT